MRPFTKAVASPYLTSHPIYTHVTDQKAGLDKWLTKDKVTQARDAGMELTLADKLGPPAWPGGWEDHMVLMTKKLTTLTTRQTSRLQDKVVVPSKNRINKR